jgi:hypothetical protein
MLIPTFLCVASLLVPAALVVAPGGTIRADIDAPIHEAVLPDQGPVSVSVLAGGIVVRLDCSRCAHGQGQLDTLRSNKPKSWVARANAVKATGQLVARPGADGKPADWVLVVESLTLIPGE